MDLMVIKYLGIAAVTYGTHLYLAIIQILLAGFLIITGILHLSNISTLGNIFRKFGFTVNKGVENKSGHSVFMIATGLVLLLPLAGISYWVAIVALPVAIYFISRLVSHPVAQVEKEPGVLARKCLIVSAALLFCFTIWEGRDLMYAGWSISSKAKYWRTKEVDIWQKEHNPNAPKVGQLAPDFELTGLTDSETMRLSDYRGVKPIVLLFGSFT